MDLVGSPAKFADGTVSAPSITLRYRLKNHFRFHGYSPMTGKRKFEININERSYETMPEEGYKMNPSEQQKGWAHPAGTKEKTVFNRRRGIRRYRLQTKFKRVKVPKIEAK